MGLSPGNREDKIVHLVQMIKIILRESVMGLALITHGIVAKKEMVLIPWSLRKEETKHMLDPLGNLERSMNLDLNQRMGEETIMMEHHMNWRVTGRNQILLGQEKM